MKILLTLIHLFFFYTLLGQIKILNNVTDSNGDTSFWYKYQNIVINELSLTSLDTSTSPYYFRIWKANQVLDIWKEDDNSFSGQLTFWVTERVPYKEKRTDRILIDKRVLQSDSVKQIFNLVDELQIVKLPVDDSIKGWKHGFDGITYIIEFSSKTNYNFKTYWNPKAQDTALSEAKLVQSFVDKIFDLSNSTITWKQFEKLIPYECYNVGGNNACKIVTKKEKRRLAKEREKYRKQMH